MLISDNQIREKSLAIGAAVVTAIAQIPIDRKMTGFTEVLQFSLDETRELRTENEVSRPSSRPAAVICHC
jgi:hypothetical protein